MKKDRKYLIVGLGNAEAKYNGTRHHTGYEVVHALAKYLKGTFRATDYAYVAEVNCNGHPLFIIMPTTYMNLSGIAVRQWLTQEKISVDSLLVVSDDIDLPVGDLRLKPKGGGGSHNGLGHIVEFLGHGNFPRLRFGIGKNYAHGHQTGYVLGKFEHDEYVKIVSPAIDKAVLMIKTFVTTGLMRTMNKFNTRPKPIKDPDDQ
ncbi:MAG: aminoacyl-tRNA hydrolase [Bacteroidales bacterium]|jgi:PTH1 family peptidyl-tRNA hydrolase|nr:aminoacyl-tRNA hydrolase [Bacteroidales bacterium]